MGLKLDWDDLRYFLSVARNRTLAGAAKELRVTQSTVGRRIASFEKTVGARLLHRNADGYVLTLAGGAILVQAMKVESGARKRATLCPAALSFGDVAAVVTEILGREMRHQQAVSHLFCANGGSGLRPIERR